MVRAMLVFTVLSASTHASAALRILTDALPVARVGVPYSVQLQAEGGLPPYTWSAAPLPRGLTLRDDVIEGTPEVPDDHTGPTLVTITVRDRTSNDMASWTLALTVLVSSGLQMVGEPAGGVCTIGSQYLVNVMAHGGVRPYTWHTWGLPAGVSCDTSLRHLSCVGYPVQSGAHHVGILLEDAAGERVLEEFVVDCIGDPPEIGPAHLLCASVGRPYEEQLYSNYSSVEWSVVAGSLPPGLSVDASGAIRGNVPADTSTNELFVFRVRAIHERAGPAERDMAILTAPENVGCHSPDPENPGSGGGGNGGWGGDPGAGGTGGGAGGSGGSAGTGGSGGSGGSKGTGGSGGIAGTPRPVRAQSGCDCNATSAPDALLAAAALVWLRRRR